MFLRKKRKKFDGENYEYWTLCETVRTERGPGQRVVASLGKLSEEDIKPGWDDIEALLEGRRPSPKQYDLFEPTAPRQNQPSSGDGIFNSPKLKPPFALPKGTSVCAPSITKKPIAFKHICLDAS